MQKFKRDPNYLLAYCVQTALLFAALDVILAATRNLSWRFGVTPVDALIPLAVLLFCGLPSSLMHNCAHGNVGRRWVNQLVGELCGTIMLYGFGGFRLGHLFHHKYPDNPKYDPHPPQGLSFPAFLVAPVKATLLVIETAYYESFGETDAAKANIRWQRRLFKLDVALKVVFWLLLFGPKGFVLFYLPLYLANIFVFAHINYATHVDRGDGQIEIIDLTSGIYYRAVNLISFGGYFHKTHHLRPRTFNPSRAVLPAELRERPLLSFRMPAAAAATRQESSHPLVLAGRRSS